MGPVPLGTPVGHGPGGLQRQRRRVELLRRTITRARAPTAGARTAWPGSPTTSSGCASRSRCGTGSDPIIKERLFGLTNSEGNHGEDVKEYYFYLDSTPTHSYMKYLYKYPQAAYPYGDLLATNRGRGRGDCGVRAARYRRVRRRPLLRRPGRVREGGSRRPPRRDHRHEPRARAGDARTSCRPSGSATPGRGATTRPSRVLRDASTPSSAVIAASHPDLGDRYLACADVAVAAVHGERDQHATGCSGLPNADPVRQGRHRPLHRPRANATR